MGFILLLIPCLFATVATADNVPWYKNAVIYQLYVRSFQDSNGDGIGDLKGITQRAPYLQSLGVDAVWLSPIYKTPNADYGYDISDMESVNPEYGTLEDFDELLKELNSRGIKVIMDYVPNHTSVKHRWFKASEERNDTVEKYSDFYVWQDPTGYDADQKPLPPNNWLSVMGTGSAWEWSEKRKQFYLHTFLVEQADLNYNNPVVIKKMQEVLQWWMRRGVSGFRMDAVSWIYDDLACGDEPHSPDYNPKDPNNYGGLVHECTQDQPKTYDIIKSFRSTIDHFEEYIKYQPERIMMTESYSDFDAVVKYYGEKDSRGSTFPFNFFFVTHVNQESDANDWKVIMNQWLDLIKDDKWPNWVPEESESLLIAFYPRVKLDGTSRMWIWIYMDLHNQGKIAYSKDYIGNHDQHRAASRFTDEWVDLLHMMTMTLRGTVLTYNGEELGLEDSIVRFDQGKDLQGLRAGPKEFKARSRDFERGPMPWDPSLNGAFTKVRPWLPLAPSYRYRNAKIEASDKNSHLEVYKALVKLRKSKTLTDGDISIHTTDSNVIIIIRYLDDNPTVLTVINIGEFQVTVDLGQLRNSLPAILKPVIGSYNFPMHSSFNSSSVFLPQKSGVVLTCY